MNKIEIKISHPPEWPTKTIYEACQIVSRGTAPVYVENSTVLAIGQRCVREFGLQPEEARFHDQRSMTRVLKACKGDVLLNSTGTGTIGRSCIFNADGTYIIDGHVTLLRSDPDQLDGRWLNALLQSPQGQLHIETQCYSGSTNQVELSREHLSATSIPLPSLPEQRRIAEILDTIDEAIQKTEALISKLKAMKQGLLHDLLTRGLDENGKLRNPKTHPEHFKDSPLGRTPKDWDIHSLEDFSKYISYGFTNPMPSTTEGPWMITAFDIGDGIIKYKQARHTSMYSFNHQLTPKSKPSKGDLLITKDGTLGRVAIVDSEYLCINQSVACIQPLQNADISFLFHYLQAQNTQERMLADAGGSAIKHIYVSKLRNLEIVYPGRKEREKIVKIINSHDIRIRTEEQYRDKLKLQKKGLMHDLLTGKVGVRV